MDESIVARWTRYLSRYLSRRGLGGLGAGALGAVGLVTDVGAKKKRRGKNKRKKPCRGGTKRCGKICANTRISAAHCGGCGRGCDTNEVCLNGACSRYRFVTAWGSQGNGDEQFSALGALAVHGDGNLYVADSGAHRVQKFDTDGTLITMWGSVPQGTGDGEFAFPQGIDVDSSGTIHVTDFNNRRIQTFDSDGEFIGKWESRGNDDQLFGPEAIAIDGSGNAFVVDRLGDRIQKFDGDGTFVTSWIIEGSDQFIGPEGVAVDGNGDVFVADTASHRIQKFDNDGEFLLEWGAQGSGEGQLMSPAAVAVDAEGNVFVADAGNHRIQKCAPNALDPDQYDFVTAWGFQGSANGEFDQPLDVAVDADGNVFVADFGNFRIQKFAPVNGAPRLGDASRQKQGKDRGVRGRKGGKPR